MRKTLDVKEYLERGKSESVYDAVIKADMSRSAFYKYRDAVFPLQSIQHTQIITLFFHLADQSGTLSRLLDIVAKAGGNILTLHQTIPIHGKANVTLSLDVEHLTIDLDQLIFRLTSEEHIACGALLSSGMEG